MGIKISDKIDVVIPAHEKDSKTLPYCVARAKKCVENIGRVFVISKDKLVDNAEWFSEDDFPFSKKDVQQIIDGKVSHRVGWYFQQLLKLYAPFVIPNISKNVLFLDADTVFYKKIKFFDVVNNKKLSYLSIGKDKHLETNPFTIESRKYIENIMPDLNLDVLSENGQWITGICHHMLVNRDILIEMFTNISKRNNDKDFWRLFLEFSSRGAVPSEYEMYFTYMLNKHPDLIKLRRLNYKNTRDFNLLKYYIEILRKKYDYCSYHEREFYKKERDENSKKTS